VTDWRRAAMQAREWMMSSGDPGQEVLLLYRTWDPEKREVKGNIVQTGTRWM
jgi:hypothetical protein